MSLSCNVTQDLLPLYHDGVCSDESRALVEAHLANCPECAELLSNLRGEIDFPHEEPDDGAVLRKLEKNVRRGKNRAWIKGAAAVLAVVLLVFGGVNLWWYTQVYQFYAAFAEGKSQPMSHEYDPDTGEVIASYPLDESSFEWHTENMKYFHVVHLPDYLQDNGDVSLHIMPWWMDDGIKNGGEGKMISVGVYIGRELYAYSVHLSIIERRMNPQTGYLEETRTEECVMLDKELNQVYLDHWDSDFRMRQDILLTEYHEQIMEVVEAARAEWPFLAEE